MGALQAVKANVDEDEDFWALAMSAINRAINLVKPMSDCILKLEGDGANIGDVPTEFARMQKKKNQNFPVTMMLIKLKKW